MEFIKLRDLVDSQFTVQRVTGYKFKRWDNEQRKMLVSDEWQKDYRKMYSVETDKGLLDLSASQLGSMLEGVCWHGRSDVNGATFAVKSNNKEGMDIRYFINPMKTPKTSSEVEDIPEDW